MGDLAVPLLTLVALLVAFVLLETFASFRVASDGAGQEAGALMAEAEAASLLLPSVGPFWWGHCRATPEPADRERYRGPAAAAQRGRGFGAHGGACAHRVLGGRAAGRVGGAQRSARPTVRGAGHIEPTHMEAVERFIGELLYGADPPCDDRGQPR